MKTSILIEDGSISVSLTPEGEFERYAISQLQKCKGQIIVSTPQQEYTFNRDRNYTPPLVLSLQKNPT